MTNIEELMRMFDQTAEGVAIAIEAYEEGRKGPRDEDSQWEERLAAAVVEKAQARHKEAAMALWLALTKLDVQELDPVVEWASKGWVSPEKRDEIAALRKAAVERAEDSYNEGGGV